MSSRVPYKLGIDVASPDPTGAAGLMINDDLKAIADRLQSHEFSISGFSVSGLSGFSGASGASGASGLSGASGVSGFSGASGLSGASGTSGASGASGRSGSSGFSGASGTSGATGPQGSSGFSGGSGSSGTSGASGASGRSGASGFSGWSGASGSQGFSGVSGTSGAPGVASGSGFSGASGVSGRSGFSGASGVSGNDGCARVYTVVISGSGYQIDGTWTLTRSGGTWSYDNGAGTTFTMSGSAGSGWTLNATDVFGESGGGNAAIWTASASTCPPIGASNWTRTTNTWTSPPTLNSITNEYAAASGFSGVSGRSGFSGASGISGRSGTSGMSGYSGFSGSPGGTGNSGVSGTSGRSGVSGFSGASAAIGGSNTQVQYNSAGAFAGASDLTYTTALLTAPQVAATLRVTSGVVALTDAATITVDASLGNHFTVTLAGNRTLANPTNPTSGQKITFALRQDATGSRTITLDTNYRLGTDITAVTLTTTAAKTDYLACVYNATDSKWDVVSFIKGY